MTKIVMLIVYLDYIPSLRFIQYIKKFSKRARPKGGRAKEMMRHFKGGRE